MTRDEILDIVDDKHFFTVTFLKASGEKRVMNCQFGTVKYTKGVGKKFEDADHNLITVYDLKAKGYRSFKADRVISIKAHGEVYE